MNRNPATAAARPSEIAAIVVILAGAAFSFYTLRSRFFDCGAYLSAIEIRYWLGLSAMQGLAFLLAASSPRVALAYRVLQYATLAVVVVVLAQLAAAFPRLFATMAACSLFYWVVVAVDVLFVRRADPRPAFDLGATIAETAVFLLATLVVHSSLAFVALHVPGGYLGDGLFWTIAVSSACLVAWLVRVGPRLGAVRLDQVPPLALLLLVLLRAKLPDEAYDTMFYKATIPLMIADWRTALTGIHDHTLLGTDLIEIMASQLRILDPGYPFGMTSSLGFLGLWVLAPLAARMACPERLAGGRELAVRAAALLMVSISEPLNAAGTSYHEPVMSLLMAAFLLPTPLAWVFLAAGFAAKATIGFMVPPLIGLRLLAQRDRGPWVPLGRARWAAIAACFLLAGLVSGEQLARNLAQTGRILGVAEMFVGVTDPKGDMLGPPLPVEWKVLPPAQQIGKSLVHILTLDRWIAPTVLDFHAFPSSRVIPIALGLALCFVVFGRLRRERETLSLLVIWGVCSAALLTIFIQGRHFAPISFVAALLVARAAGVVAREAGDIRPAPKVYLAAALALAAFGDQVVGTFINFGWVCHRTLAGPVVSVNYDTPQTALEKRLAEIVAQYRRVAPLGVPPSIVCDLTTDRKRYLGTHHAFAPMSTDFVQRALSVDADRARLLPSSILAVCFKSPEFVGRMLPPAQRGEFDEVPGADGVRILVSRRLLAGGAATSLPASMSAWTNAEPPSEVRDLLSAWSTAKPLNLAPADTPGGKGAFATNVDGIPIAVVLSTYGVSFEEVEYREGSVVVIEAAMPFANSDGMALLVSLETLEGARHEVTVPLRPRPEASAPLVWETKHVTVPAKLSGKGRLAISGVSPSGDITADWAYVRKLRLERSSK